MFLQLLCPALLVLGVIVSIPRVGDPLLRRLERGLRALGRRPALCIGLVFAIALGLATFASLAIWMPLPHVHDEFSHLLAADTFRHGRLTNPPHPMWQSFETFHVLQQPTYMSKFAPGPGAFLALGWIVAGMPIAGVWLTYALACAATCWMLFQWLPPRWAAMGGLLLMIQPTMFDWGQSFWGGSVGVLGGALLVGGLRRHERSSSAGAMWLAGAGLLLLANSRPYEGFVLAVIALAAFAWRCVRRRGARATTAGLLPIAVCGVAALAFAAYYNQRVTGDPLVFPHQLYARTYAPSPYFIGGHPDPIPQYRHDVMRRYHTGPELLAWQLERTPAGFVAAIATKFRILAEAALSVPMKLIPGEPRVDVWIPALALAGLPWVVRRRGDSRRIFWMLVAFFAAACYVLWMQPQYAAPAVCLAVLLWIESFRHLRVWWRRKRIGVFVARMLVVAVIAAFGTQLWEISLGYGDQWANAMTRPRVIDYLAKLPGRDLVIVRYAPNHFLHFEWVYNEADIDASEVVWARESYPETNDRLRAYYSDRRIWLLIADAGPPRLIPLDSAMR